MEHVDQQGQGRARHYPEEIKTAARGLYLRRYTVAEIADALNVPKRTLYHWAATDDWDALLTHETPEQAMARRLAILVERDGKTPQELKEVELLIGSMERLQAMRARELSRRAVEGVGEARAEAQGGMEKRPQDGAARKRGPKVKNDVSRLTPAMFQEKFHVRFYDYQRAWRAAQAQRNRAILKSRQVGATWYFSQEAFENAALTGDNQIFLSATRAQSNVFRIRNYDVSQEIYGMPYYLGAVQSMLLNEDATLFRRRYYRNGAHMGYIFYSASSGLDEDSRNKIKAAIEGSKGLGNFRNMFLHIPNGREKDIQILPVGDFSTKDELERIKNLSRDDIIASHRIPPAMASIIPTNTAGFGDITKADAVYARNEVQPIREILLEVNSCLRPGLTVSWPAIEEVGA
jgi:PBSX family phage portal protein